MTESAIRVGRRGCHIGGGWDAEDLIGAQRSWAVSHTTFISNITQAVIVTIDLRVWGGRMKLLLLLEQTVRFGEHSLNVTTTSGHFIAVVDHTRMITQKFQVSSVRVGRTRTYRRIGTRHCAGITWPPIVPMTLQTGRWSFGRASL